MRSRIEFAGDRPDQVQEIEMRRSKKAARPKIAKPTAAKTRAAKTKAAKTKAASAKGAKGDIAQQVRIKRAYEPPSSEDGTRVLVDRLWPRGVSKADAHIAQWMKEIAPSNELRQWFGHDPQRWDEFRRRYRAELAAKREMLDELRSRANKERVTLIYSAHDEAHNQAVALREVLASHP